MALIKEHYHEVDDPSTSVIPESAAESALKAHEAAANPHTAYYRKPSTPEVPATPDAQDVVDALVTLGLVTQAAS